MNRRSGPHSDQHRLAEPWTLGGLGRDGLRGAQAARRQVTAGEVALEAVRLRRVPQAACADGKSDGRGVAQVVARCAGVRWCRTGAVEVGGCRRRRRELRRQGFSGGGSTAEVCRCRR